MAIAACLWEGGAVAGAQLCLATILDQDQFAFQHIDEFVLMGVPVALTRPVAGRQAHQIDPEIGQPAFIAQPLPYPLSRARIEGRRIARAHALGTAAMSILGMAKLPGRLDQA